MPRKISQDQEILGEDGIECFDLDMLQSDAQDDLRLSIGAQMVQQNMPPPILKNSGQSFAKDFLPESELLSKLERSKIEYDSLKESKERMERAKIEQQLETTIEMKETIEILQEESLVKHQLLNKYESQIKEQAHEVSPQ